MKWRNVLKTILGPNGLRWCCVREPRTVDSFPRRILLQPTAYCNANCELCPYERIARTLPLGTMTQVLFSKIVDECRDAPNVVETLGLYLMGEPFLDKELLQKLRYAKGVLSKTRLSVHTNASMLTKEVADELVGLVEEVCLSVQGGSSREQYQRYMPSLDYNRVMANIDYFLRRVTVGGDRLSIRNIRIHNVVPPADVDKEKAYWREKGIIDSNIVLFERVSSRASFLFPARAPDGRRMSGCKFMNCPMTFLNVLYNGDVILCCEDWQREVVLGNVEHESISSIWKGKRYQEVRDWIYGRSNPPPNFICRRCEDAIYE